MANIVCYDVETTGLDPAQQRIIQFAGQRTDSELNIIGKPFNWLVSLDSDVVPDPEAILVHGIPPQKANIEGITERELAQYLAAEVFTPGTLAIGFNNISFDDKFIDHVFWRNFYDAFAWRHSAKRSRWDLLDTIRMVRALRPEGINWPVDDEGIPTNRLELLAQANGIEEGVAHDAQADVLATIGLAKVVRSKQPNMYKYLLDYRSKVEVLKTISIEHPTPFVLTTGKITNEFCNTTVAVALGWHPLHKNTLLVYDLRYDPSEFAGLTAEELAERIVIPKTEQEQVTRLPVIKIAPNKCPAVAPIGVLNCAAQARISLPLASAADNYEKLRRMSDFRLRLIKAYELLGLPPKRKDPESKLYERLVHYSDRTRLRQALGKTSLQLFDDLEQPKYSDARLKKMYVHYLGRNFPDKLTKEQRLVWVNYTYSKLIHGIDGSRSLNRYFAKIKQLKSNPELSSRDYDLLSQLEQYGHEIIPPELDNQTLLYKGKTYEEWFTKTIFK